MYNFSGLSSLVTCIALLTLLSSFDAYRIDGINPTCQMVSAPICKPMTNVIAVTNGRNRRSAISNHISTSSGKVREKRRARVSASTAVEWRYNSTTFPNFANDRTPDDVMDSLRRLHPLIATECSKFAKMFLCSVYSPVCTEFGVVPPCRELCEKVLSDCAHTIRTFGIEWPESIQCSLFPSQDSSTGVSNEGAFYERVIYEREDSGILIQRAVSLVWIEALVADGKICIPPDEDDVITPKLELLEKNIHRRPTTNNTSGKYSKANHQFGIWCPAEMRSPPGQLGYSFLGMDNCSPPCPNMYLSDGELSGIRSVIIVMSTLCIIVTFFTLCTFLMDRNRFRYPERPIVFYALSYFIVSLVFMIGFSIRENAACNEEIRDIDTHDIVQGFTVVKGYHKQSCTLLFMILYYFTVNGTIWWLILTVTWLLAAGFKWGSEAIEKYSMYYHSIAWGIPAVQTMVVVTFSKIEGDNISGVCFLGLYDSEGLRYMLLTPLCVYLFIGISTLCAGFCCLNRVRIKLKGDETNKRKLSKFMLRIGVFSVMYIVPQVVLLAIYVYEDSHRTQWEASWFMKACDEYRVPCPADGSNVTVTAGNGGGQPPVALFCVKYIMTLIVALPPLFWVASKKTLNSWQDFCCHDNRSASGVVTVNNNSNRFRPTSSSRRVLLRNDSTMAQTNNKQRTIGDGGIDHEVFVGLEASQQIHGSSASVAAEAKAAAEKHSRANAVLERTVQDAKTPPPPPPPPVLQELPVATKPELKKQFPEKRRHHRPVSSASASSRVASSLQRPSSSTSSLTSAKRRSRKSNHTTSSLNRAGSKEKVARDLERQLHTPPTTVLSQRPPPTKPKPSVPPIKPQRTSLTMTPQASTSSSSNVASFKQPSREAITTVVKAMPQADRDDAVEV